MVDLYKITPLALQPDINLDGLFLPFSEDYVLIQFTGLKDKNGKEIYDGDIVRHHDGSFGKVVWNNELAQFLIGSGKVNHRPIGWPDFEVIGNVWEHPHLLKGDK